MALHRRIVRAARVNKSLAVRITITINDSGSNLAILLYISSLYLSIEKIVEKSFPKEYLQGMLLWRKIVREWVDRR